MAQGQKGRHLSSRTIPGMLLGSHGRQLCRFVSSQVLSAHLQLEDLSGDRQSCGGAFVIGVTARIGDWTAMGSLPAAATPK